jgi:hypothetical protein
MADDFETFAVANFGRAYELIVNYAGESQLGDGTLKEIKGSVVFKPDTLLMVAGI